MKGGWVYIMTNGAHGTLYIGVTSNLAARVTQHREGRGSEFCAEHRLTRLAYAERHDDIRDAIAREKAMKKWKRQWKLRLIRQQTPIGATSTRTSRPPTPDHLDRGPAATSPSPLRRQGPS